MKILAALLFLLNIAAAGGQSALALVKVAAAVMAANLVEHPDPICSPEHKGDKLSGSIVLDAIIAPDGRVANLSVISGPEGLQSCVTDAVSQWTYKPYLVNGQPVAVETTITISFDSGEPKMSVPVRVSGGIIAGTIQTKGQPSCTWSDQEHIVGATVMHVIIGTDGHIAEIHPISGPEAIRTCMMENIRQWTYRPYLLNGIPTAIETTITISI